MDKEERLLLIEELEPDINIDLTDDFDFTPDKKPAISTMKTNLRELDKRQKTPHNSGFVQQFDKLKMWVDLSENDEIIEFNFNIDSSNMFASDTPATPDTAIEEERRFQATVESYNNDTSIDNDNTFDDDFFWEEENDDNETPEISISEETVDITTDEITDTQQSTNNGNKYPDCKIKFSHKTGGHVNTYIKNDKLIIYLTGSFMRTSESLGYLTRNNIRVALDKVCKQAGFRFNANQFILNAGVYLCDICIDLELKNLERYFLAVSSLFPLASNRHRIMKFGNHGLKLKSLAKNAGSSLTFYNKGRRIHELLNRRIARTGEDINKLLLQYPSNIDNILRIEVQIYSLHDMRALLGIDSDEPSVVRLLDVLNSRAMPILSRFEAFEATEEKLQDEIFIYTKRESKQNTDLQKLSRFIRILAAERIAELAEANKPNMAQLKAHIITEYEFNNEVTINNLVSFIKEHYWDFLLYRKPKSIKLIIDLLDQVHTYYGRGVGDTNE